MLDALGSMNLTRLAQALNVLPSTALRMIERLAAQGLLRREPSPASRRDSLIILTDGGRRVVRQVSEVSRAHITQIIAAVPRTKRAGLLDALDSFAEAAVQLGHGECTTTSPVTVLAPFRLNPEPCPRRGGKAPCGCHGSRAVSGDPLAGLLIRMSMLPLRDHGIMRALFARQFLLIPV